MDRTSAAPNLGYIVGGADVLLFLGAGLTDVSPGSVTQQLTVLGSVPAGSRLAENATQWHQLAWTDHPS